MINRYDTFTVMAMVEEVEPQRNFFTSLFFNNQVFFTTKFIEFDMRVGGKRVAPFVSPLVAGVPMTREGFITKSMQPAYLKPKSFVQPTDALVRTAGEGYHNAQMSPAQRMDMLMAQELNEHGMMIDNRLEWMASKAILDGGYLVSGEDYQSVYVDFQHDPALRIALAGLATWNLNTSAPIDDIELVSQLIRSKSKGVVANNIVFGTQAWQYFRRHASVKDRIDTNYRRPSTTVIDDGVQNDTGAQYVGRLDGKFDLWVFEDYMTDNDGNDVPVMDPNKIIISNPSSIQGAQYFGAILDADADFQAVKMFSKSRSSFDPTGEELLSQSAPLVAPKRLNAWAVIDVA